MSIALFLHIASGSAALISGLLVFFFPKGNHQHKKLGRIFYYAMLSTSYSALLLSWEKSSAFLFTIGIFTLYQTVSGRRAIKNKSLRPQLLDYLLTVVILSNGIYMMATINIVLVVFGGLCVLLGIQDLVLYYKFRKQIPLPHNAWLARHIGLMMGSFIATLTAFIVVNIRDVEPAWLPWLAPTFILTPLMSYWSRKYTRQSL
jgi:uncharacterized membrane protein